MQYKAVYFNRGNVESLKENLSDLLLDKSKVDRYRSDAQDYICQRYNWDQVVEWTVGLYRGVQKDSVEK